jgi:hypothetical protein
MSEEKSYRKGWSGTVDEVPSDREQEKPGVGAGIGTKVAAFFKKVAMMGKKYPTYTDNQTHMSGEMPTATDGENDLTGK